MVFVEEAVALVTALSATEVVTTVVESTVAGLVAVDRPLIVALPVAVRMVYSQVVSELPGEELRLVLLVSWHCHQELQAVAEAWARLLGLSVWRLPLRSLKEASALLDGQCAWPLPRWLAEPLQCVLGPRLLMQFRRNPCLALERRRHPEICRTDFGP